jgi:hypothetical protein
MRKVILAAMLMLVGAGVEAAPIPGSSYKVMAWQVGAYTNDQTGKFSHCAMSTAYQSGITMLFSVSENYSWRVGWAHESWNLTPGQKLNISLYIDGAGPQVVTAVAINKSMALAELPSTMSLFDQFRKGYQLRVIAQGNTYGFNLDGTNAALTEVANCVSRYVPNARPPAPPAPILGTTQQQGPAKPGITTLPAEQRLEATTLAANLLAQGEMTGYRILTAKDIEELDIPQLSTWHVVWRSEDVLGVVRIIPQNVAKKASEISSAMLADDSKNCDGKFASGTTPDDKSKGTTRLFTACKSKKTAWETHYIIIPRDEGGFYLLGTFGRSPDKDPADKVAEADGLLRAAVFQVLKR